jgi:hypothetical protein
MRFSMADQEFLNNFLNETEDYCSNFNTPVDIKLPKDFHDMAERIKTVIFKLKSLPLKYLTNPAISELTSNLIDWKIINDPEKLNLNQNEMTQLKQRGNEFIS